MQYEDRVSISTPEGVQIDLILAGLGSRFVASLLDFLIKVLVLALLFVLYLIVGSSESFGSVAFAVLTILAFFSMFFVYDIVFEVWGGGKTPGKRATGLRVIKDGGGPVTLTSSLVRNLLRVIDFLPVTYLIGIIAILTNPANKRLGDLAAGTLVVRERRDIEAAAWKPPDWVIKEGRGWDVSGVTQEDAAAVANFIERRGSLNQRARDEIAVQLAARLYPKVRGAPTNLRAEAFLERLLTAKRART